METEQSCDTEQGSGGGVTLVEQVDVAELAVFLLWLSSTRMLVTSGSTWINFLLFNDVLLGD